MPLKIAKVEHNPNNPNLFFAKVIPADGSPECWAIPNDQAVHFDLSVGDYVQISISSPSDQFCNVQEVLG